MKHYQVVLLILIFTLGLLSNSANALKLTPSKFELKPKGSGSSFVFDVENDQDIMVAVEVRVFTRELGKNNEEINTEASDLFEIFPSQIILNKNSEKKLRVRWIGGSKLDSERAFRLQVSQLPVSFSKDKEDASVKVLHQVIGALYVTPSGAESKLSIEKAFKDGDRLIFDVRNKGTKHSLLSEYSVVVQGEADVMLQASDFSKLKTQNVLAKSLLRVNLEWPKNVGDELKSVTIK